MLDFGFSEIVLTSAIALIVLGPEKLPKAARQVGNWMGRARVMARQLTEQLEREVDADDLLKQTRKTAAQTGVAQTGVAQTDLSIAPPPFDTTFTPPLTPSSAAPGPSSAAPGPSSPSPPPPNDPPQAASLPHGLDWHPTPRDNKSSDG